MTTLFQCDRCPLDVGVTFAEMAEHHARESNPSSGNRWWQPQRPWALIQADMVESMYGRRRRLCGKHASLLAEMVIWSMQALCYEHAGVRPGTVTRRDRELVDGPYEQLGRIRLVDTMIGQIRRVVAGDRRAGAMVDVDEAQLRLRCTLTVIDADGAWTAAVPMGRMGLTADVVQVVRAGT